MRVLLTSKWSLLGISTFVIINLILIYIYLNIDINDLILIHDSKNENMMSEGYLLYNPHSGYHNQRISLQNAFLLAYWTNRTLVLPPILLGNAIPWHPFNLMIPLLGKAMKSFLNIQPYLKSIHEEESFINDTLYYKVERIFVPWSFLVNFNTLKPHIKFISDHEFEKRFHIDRYSFESWDNLTQITSIEFVKDNTRYAYGFYYFPTDPKNSNFTENMKRFDTTLDASQWIWNSPSSPRILHFGSLFGSNRLYVSSEKDKLLFNKIQSAFIIKNSNLESIATSITKKLGGFDQFLGIHARTKDGMFAKKSDEIIANISMDIHNWVNYNDHDQEDLVTNSNLKEPKKKPFISLGNITDSSFRIKTCLENNIKKGKKRKSSKSHNYPIIFMATDRPNASQLPLYQPLYERFLCVFTLDDFPNEVSLLYKGKSISSQSEKENHENNKDKDDDDDDDSDPLYYNVFNRRCGHFMLQFLDVLIASRGRKFFGTNRSTFSTFGDFLHQIQHINN